MIGSIAITLLAFFLVFGEPWFGRLSHRRMLAALDRGVPNARQRFYLQWTWQGWALAAITVAVTLGLAGWSPAQLGLRLPYWPHWPANGGASGSFVKGAAAGAVAAVILGALAGIVATCRRRRGHGTRGSSGRPSAMAANRNLLRMLPRTPDERRAFAALAVSAGIGEEIVWRGFGLTLLFALLPSSHPAVPIALAAIAFGWAHLYQGAIGMFVTAVIGAALAVLFWASGSLLWPMLIHVLIDLRVLLVRAPTPTHTGGMP